MDIPYDLIAAIQPQDYRDNASASAYAYEKLKDYEVDLPVHFQGPSDLQIGSEKGSYIARTVYRRIVDLKREKDGPRGRHAAL